MGGRGVPDRARSNAIAGSSQSGDSTFRSPSRADSSVEAEAALSYDRWFDLPWGRYASDIETRALLGALGQIDGKTVLDAGCGTGRFAAALAARGARVAGIDMNLAMLEVAGARMRGTLVLGDAHSLPFRDECFDAAVAVTVCEFAARPDQVVDELVRVTRRGGRAVIGALNPRSAWGLAHRKRFRDPPWNAARLMTRAELRSLCERYGRTSVRSALFAPGMVTGLRVGGPLLETLRFVVPSLGAFQVALITRE